MKKVSLLVLLLLPCFAYAQATTFNLGDARFFLDTNIMDDGSITTAGFGLGYSEVWAGEIRGQVEKRSSNVEINNNNVKDSLIATTETIYELYLLPVQYRSTVNKNLGWWAGAGIYYEYQKRDQKGHMEEPYMAPEFDPVNSIFSDFTMHVYGPIIDAGVNYNSEWFRVGFSAGIVPFYFLSAAETLRKFPLFDTVKHSQDKSGSPYIYLRLDSTLFKYINLGVKYNFSRVKYDVLDYEIDWDEPKVTLIFPEINYTSHVLKLEASALIPLGVMSLQVGYGYMLTSHTYDDDDPITNSKNYLILSGRKLGN